MTIKQKQCLLAYLGYYTGAVDGDWGPKSIQATRAFQNDYGIPDDGVFGPQTEKNIRVVIGSGEEKHADEEAEDAAEGADWWKGIKYFDRSEFACPCGRCGGFPVEPDRELVEQGDNVREALGIVDISSGVRCQLHNDELPGSVPNSRHVRGKAMDFRVRGKTSAQTLAYVQTLPVRYAYAIDSSFVHMDVE